MEPKGARSYVAELVGTFLLVLFICLVVSLTSKAALGFTDWAVIGLVHAFVLFGFDHGVGCGPSGGHFNPAVTLAVDRTRKFPWGRRRLHPLQLAGACSPR